jgi:hypothetical protein
MNATSSFRLVAALFMLGGAAAPWARADTDALIFQQSTNVQTVSYYQNVAGWSFILATNIVATQIGRWGANFEGDLITLWTYTNTPLATYSLQDLASQVETDTNGVTYMPIDPLSLAAGQQYYLTLNNPITIAEAVELRSLNPSAKQMRPFAPAPELTFLSSYYYDVNHEKFTAFLSIGTLALGPTFRFLDVPTPQLKIHLAAGGAIVLAWPIDPPGFVLENSPNFTAESWTEVTNAPAISGNDYALTNRWTDQGRFFRLKSQ